MERRAESNKKSAITMKNMARSAAPSESAIKSGRGQSGQPLLKTDETQIENQGRARQAYAKMIGVSEVAVHQAGFIKDHGGKIINEKVRDGEMSMKDAYWKSKEKMQLKLPTENIKSYIFTITPEEGSQWKILRKLRPSQVSRIKQYIEKMAVSRVKKKK